MANQTIKLNKDVSIDLPKLISSRLLIQANSGGGKSYLLRRLLEQSHGKVQQIVIDLEGEFSTLREKYDYILAGKEGDTPADPKTAGLLAHKLLELNVSAIIDLYELHPNQRKLFVKNFLEAMVNAPKTLWHDCLVVIDEAHIFAPEKGDSEALNAVIGLCTLGRKRGFCAVLATQRLSKLHKDAAAECNNKLIGRTNLDIDLKRASEELGFTSKEQTQSLRRLEAGEFYGYGAAISNDIIKLKVGDVQTTHPSGGNRMTGKATPPTEKIKKILGELKGLPEEAQKELKTTDDLRREVARLRGEVTRAQTASKTAVPSQALIDAAVKKAVLDVERKHDAERTGMIKATESYLRSIVEIGKIVAPYLGKKIEIPKQPIRSIAPAQPIVRAHIPAAPAQDLEQTDTGELKGGAKRMAEVLTSRYPMKFNKPQLAAFAKMKRTGGTFGQYLSALRSRGLIVENGEYIQASELALATYGGGDMATTREDIIEMWRKNLKGGAQRMFDVLVANPDIEITKETLSEESGISLSGGTFGQYLSLLRSNELAEVRGNNVRLGRIDQI